MATTKAILRIEDIGNTDSEDDSEVSNNIDIHATGDQQDMEVCVDSEVAADSTSPGEQDEEERRGGEEYTDEDSTDENNVDEDKEQKQSHKATTHCYFIVTFLDEEYKLTNNMPSQYDLPNESVGSTFMTEIGEDDKVIHVIGERIGCEEVLYRYMIVDQVTGTKEMHDVIVGDFRPGMRNKKDRVGSGDQYSFAVGQSSMVTKRRSDQAKKAGKVAKKYITVNLSGVNEGPMWGFGKILYESEWSKDARKLIGKQTPYHMQKTSDTDINAGARICLKASADRMLKNGPLRYYKLSAKTITDRDILGNYPVLKAIYPGDREEKTAVMYEDVHYSEKADLAVKAHELLTKLYGGYETKMKSSMNNNKKIKPNSECVGQKFVFANMHKPLMGEDYSLAALLAALLELSTSKKSMQQRKVGKDGVRFNTDVPIMFQTAIYKTMTEQIVALMIERALYENEMEDLPLSEHMTLQKWRKKFYRKALIECFQQKEDQQKRKREKAQLQKDVVEGIEAVKAEGDDKTTNTSSSSKKKHTEESAEVRQEKYIENYNIKVNEVHGWVKAYCSFKDKMSKDKRDIIEQVITLMSNPLMVDATRSVLDYSYTATVLPPKDVHDFYMRSEEQAYNGVLATFRGKLGAAPAINSFGGTNSTKGRVPTPIGLTRKDVKKLAKEKCRKLDEFSEMRTQYLKTDNKNLEEFIVKCKERDQALKRVAQKYFTLTKLTAYRETMANIERHAAQLQAEYESGQINDFLTTKPILPGVLDNSMGGLLRSNLLYGAKQRRGTHGQSSRDDKDNEGENQQKVHDYIPNILDGECYQKRVVLSNDHAALCHALGLTTETILEHFVCLDEQAADAIIKQEEKEKAASFTKERDHIDCQSKEVDDGIFMTNLLLYAEEEGILTESIFDLVKRFYRSDLKLDNKENSSTDGSGSSELETSNDKQASVKTSKKKVCGSNTININKKRKQENDHYDDCVSAIQSKKKMKMSVNEGLPKQKKEKKDKNKKKAKLLQVKFPFPKIIPVQENHTISEDEEDSSDDGKWINDNEGIDYDMYAAAIAKNSQSPVKCKLPSGVNLSVKKKPKLDQKMIAKMVREQYFGVNESCGKKDTSMKRKNGKKKKKHQCQMDNDIRDDCKLFSGAISPKYAGTGRKMSQKTLQKIKHKMYAKQRDGLAERLVKSPSANGKKFNHSSSDDEDEIQLEYW